MASSSMAPARVREQGSFEDFKKFRHQQLEIARREVEELRTAQNELYDIGDCIIAKEQLFVQSRDKWMAEHQHLRSSDLNGFFIRRCEWEAEFKDAHLESLYEQRQKIARKVPCFWRDAMITNNKLFYKVTKKDLRPLMSLNDIRSNRTPDGKGFELKFFFDKNPYFKDEVLTKTYELLVDNNNSVSLRAIGTKIGWRHPSQNLTKMRGESFFNFFNSFATIDPLYFDMEADELKGDLPDDFVIGKKIRDKIVRHAISWYFNIVEDDSDFDEVDSVVAGVIDAMGD